MFPIPSTRPLYLLATGFLLLSAAVGRADAWTRRHVRDYGGDPDRIILCGHSAGGHLVALLATDETYLKDPALKLTDADRAAIRGVIGVCGVYRVPGPQEFKAMTVEMF